MTKIFTQKIVEEIKGHLRDDIIPDLEKLHDKNVAFVDKFADEYKTWKGNLSRLSDLSSIFNNTSKIYRQLEIETDKHLSFMNEGVIFRAYESLENLIRQYSNDIDEIVSQKQENIHFSSVEGNGLGLRTAKKTKNVLFKTTRLITKPFRKKESEYFWKRVIPQRNLFNHYIAHNFLNQSLKYFEVYIESACKIFVDILNYQRNTDTAFINQHIKYLVNEEMIDFEKSYSEFLDRLSIAKSNLENEFDKLTVSILEEIESQDEALIKDFLIIGTVELPKRKFKSSKIEKEISLQKKKLERSKSNYNNFISTVFDRIEFYQDLFWYSSLLISNSRNLDKYEKSFIAKTINPIIDNIKNEITSSIERIDGGSSKFSIIENEKKSLTDILDQKLIPNLLNKVSRNNTGKVLDDYSGILKNNLNEFEKEYLFVRPKSLTYRLKQDQLKQFSPKDIISPIVLEKLSASIKKITQEFDSYISKQNSTIISLGRIIEYNLDSSLIKFEEENSEKSSALDIATEGLERAINKSEEYQEQLVSKIDGAINSFYEAIIDVLDDLLALSNIDRLITIKIQVSKEKAIQDLKLTIQNYYGRFSKWFVIAKDRIVSIFTRSKAKIAGLSSRVGLSSTQMELSEAMADYLSRVSESLNKLPYVYQRLFSNEQLFDERIFIGRENETAKLEKAINYWMNNQISSVMMIGEKGSGTSSLLNIVISKFNLQQKIYRKEFSGTIYKEEELLTSFKELFQIENVNTIDQLIEELKSFEDKRVVIIENVEDFFLRVIGGFKVIKLLLEIITATNHNIMWITTCNIFTWHYLNKILNIKDYFTFNIHLTKLNNEILEKIIMSRHNISGYELEFVPSEEIEKSKSYSKLSVEGKHEYLKKEYFEELNELSVNNIGVALFLWLRSIIEFDEERIKVSTNIDLDFSFLNSLSDSKLFTLMAIVLHDGLKIEQHSLIFNSDIKESRLLFSSLADDGIIFRRNDIYKINFQLYNPIIGLLKNKNILH